MKNRDTELLDSDINMIGCRGMKKHDVDPELLLKYAQYMFPEAFAAPCEGSVSRTDKKGIHDELLIPGGRRYYHGAKA